MESKFEDEQRLSLLPGFCVVSPLGKVISEKVSKFGDGILRNRNADPIIKINHQLHQDLDRCQLSVLGD